jgi:hypothetical protein
MVSFVFFLFLATVAAIGCFRAGKIIVRVINRWFDKIEDKIV